jgi:hypothetical protein
MSGNEPPADGVPEGVDLWITKPIELAALVRVMNEFAVT